MERMNGARLLKRNVLGLGLGEPCFQSRGMVSFIGKTILRLVSEGTENMVAVFSKVFILFYFKVQPISVFRMLLE